MRHIFIMAILLVFGIRGASAQKSFIGQTKAQVKTYWSSEVAEHHFEEGDWQDSEEEFFTVQTSPASTPEFSATFKNGQCVEQFASINESDESVYADRLKKQGFTYKEDENRWVKPGVRYYWVISPGLLECLKM